MNTRAIVTLILAVLLIVLVMGFAAAVTFSGLFNAGKWTQSQVWAQSFSGMLSMNIIDVTGDKQKDIFMQNDTTIAVANADGTAVFSRKFGGSIVTSLGDVNGDGVEDIIVAHIASGPTATVLNGKGEVIWNSSLKTFSVPMRIAVVRFKEGTQVVVGDDRGAVIGLSDKGLEVWRASVGSGDYIRGLDDATLNGAIYLAAANHNGNVALLNSQGKVQWTYNYSGLLRRLRVYDLTGSGNGNLLIGGEANKLVVLDAATGKEIVSKSLGQTITEIRNAEVDGNPSTREFVVGGKSGGVWAFRGVDAFQLWSNSVPEKVMEIAAIDIDKDGADETIIGDEGGNVVLFDKSGGKFTLFTRPSNVTRIDAGKVTTGEQMVVADGSNVMLFSLFREPAPIWYNPLLIGLMLSLVIAIVAWFIATAPQKPALQVAVEDTSVEGLRAQSKMLHENIADVERMKQAGEMEADAYLLRLKELRRQLADNEAALRKVGVQIKPETFKCPNCGGTLPLGIDKCEYCGQVVVS